MKVHFHQKKNFLIGANFKGAYLGRIRSLLEELIFADKGYKTIQDGETTIYFSNYYPIYGIENCGDFLVIYKNKALTNINFTENTNTVEKIKTKVLEENKNNFCYENNQYSSNVEGFIDDYVDNFLSTVGGITYYTNNLNNNVTRNESVLESNNENEYENEILTDTENVETALTSETPDVVSPSENLVPSTDVVNPTTQNTVVPENNSYEFEYHTATLEDFTFYTSFNPELPEDNEIKIAINFMKELAPYEKQIIIAMPISVILTLIICIYLINSIGHVKGKEEIELTDFDKMPLDVIFIVFFMIIALLCVIVGETSTSLMMATDSFLAVIITIYLSISILTEMFMVTTIARIKAKKLLDTSICGRLLKWCIKILKEVLNQTIKICHKFKSKFSQIMNSLNENVKLTWKVMIYIALYIIISFILIGIFDGFGFFLDILIFLYVLYLVIYRINSFTKLEAGLKEIYDGNNKTRLYKDDFSKEFENCIDYINDISNGIEKAVEESLKSERLKTELITNVSHDIKTPLTSIINYVDLIKKQNIDNEKVKEYIEILDNKSQRLKKLTEDLVEASKASSGNVSLNLEEIGLVELLNQLIGEYKDKFEEKNLEVISNLSKVNVKIKADSRYLYRVIDNLFGNISKYALEGSRVYIETEIIDGGKIKTILKNISKDKLNISEEELMQRFVRGDKSRTTEGSGLGLAIARSLTELQKGNLDCKIDGDLFKVEITFDII